MNEKKSVQTDNGSCLIIVAVAAFAVILSLVWLYIAWALWSVRCDDSCYDDGNISREGSQWTDWWSSWQWDAQFFIAIAGASLLLLALSLAIAKKDIYKVPIMIAVALLATWSVFVLMIW